MGDPGSAGYREFPGAEAEVAAFIASRVAKTRDSRRDLFDRAVLLVTEVRRAGLEEINQALAGAAPAHMRQELAGTLAVPDGKKVSTLEWMRTPVTRLSGKGMVQALDR